MIWKKKTEAEGPSQTPSTKAVVLLYQSHAKTQQKENHRPISLKNIDSKMINKILGNITQTYNKKIAHNDQIGFTPEMQKWFNILKAINLINGFKDKNNNIIISIDVKNTFDKIEYTFMKKCPRECGLWKNIFNTIKTIYEEPTIKIILNRENLEVISLKLGMWQACPLSLEIARAIRQEKKIKGIQIWKLEVNLQVTGHYTLKVPKILPENPHPIHHRDRKKS